MTPTEHLGDPMESGREIALNRALDFIESLTADPLLMGLDDIEMRLEDVQAHARIELASIRKILNAATVIESTVHGAEILEVLNECWEYFDNKSDADHDGDGFVPNAEMRLASRCTEATSLVEKLGPGSAVIDALKDFVAFAGEPDPDSKSVRDQMLIKAYAKARAVTPPNLPSEPGKKI
jgi:hypothetical protein